MAFDTRFAAVLEPRTGKRRALVMLPVERLTNPHAALSADGSLLAINHNGIRVWKLADAGDGGD